MDLQGLEIVLRSAPIKLEVCTQVKNVISCLSYFAIFNANYGYTTVLTISSLTVCKVDDPMHSNNIVPGNGKNVFHVNILNVEMYFGELFKKFTKLAFDSTLSLESTSRPYFYRINECTVIPPCKYEVAKSSLSKAKKALAMAYLAISAPIMKFSFRNY
jgi:hypothetical protein